MANEEISGRVPQDDHVRDVGLGTRLYTTPFVHRLLPAKLALALVSRFGSPEARNGRAVERQQAEHLMQDLLEYTPRAGEARKLARRNVAEVARLRELFWRPWLIKHSRIVGHEHWEAAHADGRGCLIVVGHFGGLFGLAPALKHHGYHLYSVTSSHYWEPMPPGFEGLWTLRLRDYAQALGPGTAIPNDEPAERFLEVLERGDTLLIAFDLPGSAATPFLGRSVALTGAPATLAFRTGARVLPILPLRDGSHVVVNMYEPLDATHYRDASALRAAIAQVFEQLLVEHPDNVDYTWYPSPLVTEVPGDA